MEDTECPVMSSLCVLNCFYVISPTLFLYDCQSAIPISCYIFASWVHALRMPDWSKVALRFLHLFVFGLCIRTYHVPNSYIKHIVDM